VEEKRDTPATGTDLPRPRPRDVFDASAIKNTPPQPVMPKPPSHRTIAEVYELIDARLAPEIIHRIESSIPPPALEPRPSLPVRAAKGAGRWTKWAMAAIGVLSVVGQIFAEFDRYRGPISQAFIVIARVLDSAERGDPPAPE